MSEENLDSETRSALELPNEQTGEAASREEALREYAAYKDRKAREAEQEECPHDEHDHGICLECGKDILDDLIESAEVLKDE